MCTLHVWCRAIYLFNMHYSNCETSCIHWILSTRWSSAIWTYCCSLYCWLSYSMPAHISCQLVSRSTHYYWKYERYILLADVFLLQFFVSKTWCIWAHWWIRFSEDIDKISLCYVDINIIFFSEFSFNVSHIRAPSDWAQDVYKHWEEYLCVAGRDVIVYLFFFFMMMMFQLR